MGKRDVNIGREISKNENVVKADKLKTTFAKVKFIDEIKDGFGEEIKADIKLIKETVIADVKKPKRSSFFKKLFKLF